MAEFDQAYKKTATFEGGYANDPDDRGGETWKGIARKFWPKWEGWTVIDAYRDHEKFPNILSTVATLEVSVKFFYKKEFWDKIRGDEITNQEVADSLYDSSVNMGVGTAIKLAQRALGIPETGRMDNTTLSKLNFK